MSEIVLGESVEVLIDHRGKTPKKLGGEFTSSGVPVVSAMLIQGGKLHLDEARFVSPHMYQRWMSVPVKRNDVLLTSEAPLGRVALVPDDNPLVLGQRLFGLRGKPGVLDSRFLFYALQTEAVQNELRGRATGTTVTGVRQAELVKVKLTVPSYREQQAIAVILGALDDKIAVNDRIVETARELAGTYFHAAREAADSGRVDLSSVVEFLNRGVTPRYTEDPSQLCVLNQKCVRDGRVSLVPSRRTLTDRVASEKMLRHNDVLVNSTGMGTLGRVARWTGHEACTVDSHVTIVRFDPAKVDPVCSGFAMLDAEAEIESLGHGSTGQTELGRAQLSGLQITVPSKERAAELRPLLDALENCGDEALEESISLAQLRDTLLPRLMSGEIRVRDAEKVVEDVT